MSSPQQWDRQVDVVVLGSGAAGLAAATLAHDGGANVLLVEKADLVGGTTGVSGGMPWVPLNHHMADVGVTDSREEALTYIRRLTHGREPDPALVEALRRHRARGDRVPRGEDPVALLRATTFNDYFEGIPGGKPAGRSIEPVPYDARAELGEWADRARTSPHLPRLTMEEGAKYLRGDEPPDLDLIMRRADRRHPVRRPCARRLAPEGPAHARRRDRDGQPPRSISSSSTARSSACSSSTTPPPS